MRRTPNRSLAVLAALALVLTPTLAGCGDSDDDGGSDEATVLTEDQAEEVLLTQGNVGDSFEPGPEDDDDDDDGASMGCLDEVDEVIDDDAAETKAEVGFADVGDLGLPSVDNSVSSFGSVEELEKAFDDVRAALEDCTEVETTDERGVTIKLTLETDDEVTVEDADEQFSVAATGTISSQGQEFPFGSWASFARVDNHVLTVAVSDLSDTDPGTTDAYAEAAVGRLLAVLADEEPSDELVDTGAAS